MNSTIRRGVMSTNQGLGAIITTALASGAATLIVALVIGWLTVGRSAVGRDEVIELIANNAPYNREREALQNGVRANTLAIAEISQRLREMEQQGHRVEAKLDLLLSEFARRQPPTDENMTR